MKHSGTKTIVTTRLLLRPFTMNDCEQAFLNWASNHNVQTEYGEPVYSDIHQVTRLLMSWMERYTNEDFYRWAVIEKASQQNVGLIAFCKVYSDCNTAEIEYCIGESFWGRGYAGEALSAVIDYTFQNTDFIRLEAFCREANKKSIRVLEKSIMQITDNVQRFERENKLPHSESCYAITTENYFIK